MYQVFFNGLPLYDPRGTEQKLILRDPDSHLAVGEAGFMNFTIDPDHPYAGQLTKLKGVLELRADGRPIYKGRILRDTQAFDLSRAIESEGLLTCLNDSIIAPFDFPGDFESDTGYATAAASGNVVKFFLNWLLAEHNKQVSAAQRIQLGEVTVRDPNNYISRSSSEPLSAMEVLRQKITDALEGYLVVDYSVDIPVLNFYADLPLTNTQVVEYGDNLLDLTSLLDAAETYTAIYPVGADGLTLKDLPDGELTPGFFKLGSIIYSKAAEDLYGGIRITRKVDWKDVTLAANLQTKALAVLSTEGVMINQTIKTRAVDLSGETGRTPAVSKFAVGRYVELRSTPHGFRAAYPLMELNPDILNPGSTEITMGVTVKSASDLANGNLSEQKELIGQQQNQLNQQQTTITEIAQTTQESITAAIQTAEQIVLSALENYVQTSNLEDFRKTVESSLSVMAENITIKFTQTTNSITNVNGDLQRTVETLEKYFDFNTDGLIIKSGTNDMTLTLDNDMIIFKKNGQQFGWWDGVDFHTGNIVIAVDERAQFGNFAFVPRSNGSLSFLKVGG